MAKKDKSPKSSGNTVLILRNLFLAGFIIFAIYVLYTSAMSFLKNSEYFGVRQILYLPGSEFIKSTKLATLRGRNLIDIDLASLQRQLQQQYPEISQIELYKQFPDQILVIAQKRVAFAKAVVKNRTVIVDANGVALSTIGDTPDLPVINGIPLSKTEAVIGSPVRSLELRSALKVIKMFEETSTLSRWRLTRLNVDNLSQIYFFISEIRVPVPAGAKPLDPPEVGELKVIVDGEDTPQKMKILGLVLIQAKAELPNVLYIDLRFKEPILGKKETKDGKKSSAN